MKQKKDKTVDLRLLNIEPDCCSSVSTFGSNLNVFDLVTGVDVVLNDERTLLVNRLSAGKRFD